MKVKNIALPVNKLHNADGLNLMRVPRVNTATSSTFFRIVRWPHNPLFDLCGKRLACHSKLKLQRKASGHVPVQNPELPLSPILADRQFFSLSLFFLFLSLTPIQYGWAFSSPAVVMDSPRWGECLPLLDLNICPGPQAGRGWWAIPSHSLQKKKKNPAQRKPMTVPKCQTDSARPGVYMHKGNIKCCFFCPRLIQYSNSLVHTIWLS